MRRAQSATVAQPNTPETDAQETVMHIVAGTDLLGDNPWEVRVQASDPLHALSIAATLPQQAFDALHREASLDRPAKRLKPT